MPNKDFQPSTISMTPSERAVHLLRYMRKASELIEKHVQESGELPPWVGEKIIQSAQNMGMAVSYVRRPKADTRQEKEAKKKRGVT